MKPHHKAILLVLGCLIVTMILPVLLAVYWHFFIIGVIIASFGLSIGIVVVFTYIDIKNELEWEQKTNENLTYGFSEYQKRFYYNCLKYLRGEK
jgi:ABC-type bacteriocin/lantibiotic exporter with double-glycine peptidase domain